MVSSCWSKSLTPWSSSAFKALEQGNIYCTYISYMVITWISVCVVAPHTQATAKHHVLYYSLSQPAKYYNALVSNRIQVSMSTLIKPGSNFWSSVIYGLGFRWFPHDPFLRSCQTTWLLLPNYLGITEDPRAFKKNMTPHSQCSEFCLQLRTMMHVYSHSSMHVNTMWSFQMFLKT